MNEIPRSIKDFLMNPRFTFMGVDEDISKLVSEYGLDFAKSEDIRAATIIKYPRRFQRHDLNYIAEQLAGLHFTTPSSESMGRWCNIEVEDDILKLKYEYGLDCSKSADICSAAIKKWPGRFRRPGLKDLAMDVLGLHMKKP
ncbi:Werner syndrome-like exonuclease [Tanacetum coccineum]